MEIYKRLPDDVKDVVDLCAWLYNHKTKYEDVLNQLKTKKINEMLTQILESMHPDESLIFIQMLKKKLKVKGLTEKLVLEVFPDLYRKVDK